MDNFLKSYLFDISHSEFFVYNDMIVFALVKGEERYIFICDDDNRAETSRTWRRFASLPDLSFSWYDAAALSEKMPSNRKGKERQTIENRLIIFNVS